MTVEMKGLRLRPRYEELIGVAVSDKLYNSLTEMLNYKERDLSYHSLMGRV